jgi:hypothetical protein|tara:strand:+ start:106 stop:495 length:390 start_codon:yes stop_codon:yes gene_type:complete
MAKEDNKPLELRPPASPVVVDWPPSLANMTTGRYAISGGTWLRVPDDTAFEDLHLWMVVKPSEGKSEPTPGRTWTVQGSKGDEYTVTQSAGDSREIFFSCTCVGYGYRRKCKHIEGIKNKLAQEPGQKQ